MQVENENTSPFRRIHFGISSCIVKLVQCVILVFLVGHAETCLVVKEKKKSDIFSKLCEMMCL